MSIFSGDERRYSAQFEAVKERLGKMGLELIEKDQTIVGLRHQLAAAEAEIARLKSIAKPEVTIDKPPIL